MTCVNLIMPTDESRSANSAVYLAVLGLVKGSFESLVTGLGVLLYYCGLAGPVIRAFRRAPRVLMYHACQEREDDTIRGLSINTTPAHLAAQLDFLQKHYRVVPLASLTDGTLPDRAVVLTFDDGFRSVHEIAFPLLRARNLPATCYLVADAIDGKSSIWVLELNWYLQRHLAIARPLVARRFGGSRFCSIRDLVQRAIRHYDPEKMAELLAELRVKLGPAADVHPPGPRLFLDRAQIEEMARNGVTFGSHSASHAVLPRLRLSECRDEIDRARLLVQDLPGSVDSFAYPFGLNDDATRRIAVESGYGTLMEVEGDNDPFDCFHVGRLNVTSVSPAVLFARLELTARIKFRIKRMGKRLVARIRARKGNSPP